MLSSREFLHDKQKTILKALIALGAAAFAIGLAVTPQRAWGNLLIGNFYFLSLSLAAAAFIAIQYVAGAGWSTVFRRIPEAMTAYIPAGAAMTGVLFFGLHRLYHWATEETIARDAVLKSKSAYLNASGFALRAALYLGAWYFITRLLVRNSQAQDERRSGNEPDYTARNIRLSTLFLITFGLTFSLASIDWIMSLEPHWYSTIYPWYVFSGMFVHGVAVLTILLVLLRRKGGFREINQHHLHDLGKYLFAFSVFWAYLWFSQYLLIWYSNIPEETAFYVSRLGWGWNLLFWLNPALNFIVPFFLLLTVRRKKTERVLLTAGAVIILGHWLDIYLLVMPPVLGTGPRIGWLEAGVFLGLASAFVLLFNRAFRSAGPIPVHDPYLEESLHHHG